MNKYLILFIGAVYLVIGLNFFRNGNNSMGLVFVSYALANVGLAFV